MHFAVFPLLFIRGVRGDINLKKISPDVPYGSRGLLVCSGQARVVLAVERAKLHNGVGDALAGFSQLLFGFVVDEIKRRVGQKR